MVHVALKDEDKTKVDLGNLTGVIVKVDKSHSIACVTVKSGLLKSWVVLSVNCSQTCVHSASNAAALSNCWTATHCHSWFCTRGQVDLIDFQSMPYGLFHFLLNYVDHGVKFLFSMPSVCKCKHASCIAIALLEIFTVIGPLMILQSSNWSEFHGVAITANQSKKHETLVSVTDNDLSGIITRSSNSGQNVKWFRVHPPTHNQMVELKGPIALFNQRLVHG
jgi:hypothetical protein